MRASIPHRSICIHMKVKLSSVVFVAASMPAVALADTGNNAGPAVGIIAWLLIGLISGYLASRIVNKEGEGMFLDIVLGIVGAFIGGVIFRALGSQGVTGFNVWSIFVAFIGAVVLLVIYHAVRGQRRTI
jgi:uncharacterized membrane protein YeaQ/YmgE (transglycosylase-associated protein family)